MRWLNTEWEDRLRHDPNVRRLLYAYQLRRGRHRGNDPQGLARAIDRLCAAARLAPDDAAMLRAESAIRERVARLAGRSFGWEEFVPGMAQRRIPKAVVLKPWVGPREKGVVFVSFEEQWVRLLRARDLDGFAERYELVAAPAWSPPHSLTNCLFPEVYPAPVFCLISNMNDLEIFPRLSANYAMVPLFASSWVNPDWYQPLPFERKDIDILMLANYGTYKRHFALFKALRDMPERTRVLLIGHPNGSRTAETILAEAAHYGVRHRFELRTRVPDADVFDALRRAKVSLILSRREGSCVAVVESMFSGTPVGILEDAAIGSRVFINDATGRFLAHDGLAAQLTDFVATAHRYRPREWVLANGVSCFASTGVLNDRLKHHALANGQDWTLDIAPHHWRPNPTLVHALDRERLRPAYEDILARFGVALGDAAAEPGA